MPSAAQLSTLSTHEHPIEALDASLACLLVSADASGVVLVTDARTDRLLQTIALVDPARTPHGVPPTLHALMPAGAREDTLLVVAAGAITALHASPPFEAAQSAAQSAAQARQTTTAETDDGRSRTSLSSAAEALRGAPARVSAPARVGTPARAVSRLRVAAVAVCARLGRLLVLAGRDVLAFDAASGARLEGAVALCDDALSAIAIDGAERTALVGSVGGELIQLVRGEAGTPSPSLTPMPTPMPSPMLRPMLRPMPTPMPTFTSAPTPTPHAHAPRLTTPTHGLWSTPTPTPTHVLCSSGTLRHSDDATAIHPRLRACRRRDCRIARSP